MWREIGALQQKVERLEKEADWLAEHRYSCCHNTLNIKHCKHFTYGLPPQDAFAHKDCVKCWRKAAQKATQGE